jgi:hypothetical protein
MGYVFPGKNVCIDFDKNSLGYIFCDFLTNSFGNRGCRYAMTYIRLRLVFNIALAAKFYPLGCSWHPAELLTLGGKILRLPLRSSKQLSVVAPGGEQRHECSHTGKIINFQGPSLPLEPKLHPLNSTHVENWPQHWNLKHCQITLNVCSDILFWFNLMTQLASIYVS